MTDDELATTEDDPRVVTIGDLRIRRLARRHADIRLECDHRHTTMDPEGEIITCDDCGKQLSAYWLLERLARQYADARKLVKAEFERARWERQKTARMVAAKRIESSWRGGMAPTCPHCHMAILPEDGLGTFSVNRKMELERRQRDNA